MSINDLSGVPRFRQVALILEREIRSGTPAPGEPIGSLTQLTQRFGIARATASRAHFYLSERGYVATVPGVGMVVRPKHDWQPED